MHVGTLCACMCFAFSACALITEIKLSACALALAKGACAIYNVIHATYIYISSLHDSSIIWTHNNFPHLKL